MIDPLELSTLLEAGDTIVNDGALYIKAEIIEAMVAGSIIAVLTYGPTVPATEVLHQFVTLLKTLRGDFVDERK